MGTAVYREQVQQRPLVVGLRPHVVEDDQVRRELGNPVDVLPLTGLGCDPKSLCLKQVTYELENFRSVIGDEDVGALLLECIERLSGRPRRESRRSISGADAPVQAATEERSQHERVGMMGPACKGCRCVVT